MQLCSWPGAQFSLALLAFLCHTVTAVERRYYIAAVNVKWDYTSDVQQRAGSTYKKTVYREYDAGFTKAKTHPLSSGLLGPTIRGQEGDTIIVTFRNMADHPCSIHPHGIAYGKQSEGSLYFDNTSLFEKEDDVILPGKEHTYFWEVISEVTPMAADPPCITYTYLSHVDIVKDYNTGLIGAMLICKKGALDDSGNQINFHQEAVLLFGVFDENMSLYSTGAPSQPQNIKYTINGYTNGSVPDLDICAHSKVSWHMLGMSSEPELFSVHFNGQVLLHYNHKTSAIGIISGTATSASMTAVSPGRWFFSSHISRHLEAGLHGYLNIRTCEKFPAPKRRLTIQQKEESQEWTYYIAAEEVYWDYAPHMPENIDGDFRSKYLKQGPHRIGKKYKKAVFTQYKDGTFKERAEDKQRKMELGILGPVIRAQIRDVIKIVFKNKASRPYSIYPHGLAIDKSEEGASYPAGGNQTRGIQPGETYTYVWNVGEEDEPTDSDSRCLTRMYHSAVDTPRDIASGLVGPLLICKSQSLNKKNVQLRADKEQHAMFTVFDENKSWYHDENINTYCSDPKKVKKDDPEFYKSNVMHTINGYVYESGQELGFCHGEIVTWHVSSVGEQDYIQTSTFYGHTFELKNREEDMLSLFPMTGETISMNMVNIGIWLLASLNSHDSTKGMRVKFKDLECFRDYVMEYDYDKPEKFTVLKPQPNIETVKEKPKPTTHNVVDEETEYYADILGLRTLRNHSTDGELLDLSFLDHDDGIFLNTEDVTDEKDKSHNATLASSNQTHAQNLSAGGPDLEKPNQLSNQNVTNESTVEASTYITSSLDSDSEIMANNGTNITETHFPVRSASIGPENEIESIFINATDFLNSVRNSSIGNSSLEIMNETDSVFANTTHLSFNGRNHTLEGPTNETHSLSSNIRFNSSVPENISTNFTNFLDSVRNSSIGNSSSHYYGNSSLEMMNETDSVLSFNGRNLTLEEPTNETHSLSSNIRFNVSVPENISTNFTNFLDSVRNSSIVNSSSHSYGNSSVENKTDSVLSFNGRNLNLEEPIDETNRLSSNTSVNSSVPVGDRNIPVEDDGKYFNSTEEMHLLSNQTLEYDVLNKTDFQSEQSSLNSTSTVDDNSAISSHSFIYSVSSSDSLSNRSEQQEEEDFVLLDSEHLLEISKDEKTFDILPTVLPKNNTQVFSESTDDPFANTTGMSIQELNGTQWNYTSDISESAFSIPYLNFSVPSTNNTASPNTEKTLTYSNDTFEILSNVSQLFHSNNTENISISLGYFNVSSTMNSSVDSLEEVAIYLKNNHSEVILTSPLNSEEEHWGYEGTHELVQLEMPDQIKKYITDQTPAKINNPKKKKVVHHRVKPRKGHAMKTKKRKEYKPQPPSNVSPMVFSPRGFAPAGLTPRGTRPVSSEEDLLGKAIVIGVPRQDFNDYDLYVPKQVQESDYEGFLDKPEEYEFVEYKDPYSKTIDVQNMGFDATSQHFLKKAEDKDTRTYFIAAEEEGWDYAGYGQRRLDKSSSNERQTAFKKVVFRKYLDSTFSIQDIRGEMDEHLGILGPVIKAEVDQTIMIFFRNRASRPYSLHPNGVHYLKQMEGLSYDDLSPYWYKQDDAVQPNSSHVYMWTVNPKSGPQNNESDCRTWTYYSGVNPERDINSGLIGPLLVCRKGTLVKPTMDRREFVLLFMTFDENKSWYYEENRARIERKNRRTVMDPNFHESLKFDAINGIIYSLKGLRMYTSQLAKWHLINMGSPKDLHSVHFHGQTFINKNVKDHRQGVYPLLPGGFATLEMLPSKPGLWQLESEVGLSQQRGMQTLFLVLDNVCDHPLGLISGTVKDEHITASDSRGQWYPHLARLHNTGKYNAWSTTQTVQYIQVDFQRPVVISKVSTQGAKQLLTNHFVLNYTISYSTDKKNWIFYKGDSDAIRKTFGGNSDAYEVKENIFFPPLIGRYVRLHPLHSYNYPTVRLEYFGCELDGCSVPLGMQSGVITDNQITASTVASSWYTGQWHPWYARLNKQGTTNAWQAKNNDMQQWIQVELPIVKKITGIITQGAKSLGTEMFVTAFALEYSDDGRRWIKYTDDADYEQKIFQGNTDNNGQVKNYIYPPIFSRFIRVIPKRWQSCITMRIELLGCDFE